jgi:hypothetical protein
MKPQKWGGLGPLRPSNCEKKNSRSGTWDKYHFRQEITPVSLFVLFIFCNPTDNSDIGVDVWVSILADWGDASRSFLLAILATQSGGRKLANIMMVAIRNLHAEYGDCTIKQLYESVFNKAVKVTNG